MISAMNACPGSRASSLWLAVAYTGLAVSPALAADGPSDTEGISRYVLIVGNNVTSDESLAPLRYADDDAVLYERMLAPFSEKLILLSALDDETQHRYPDEAEQTRPPTRAALREALAELYQQIRAAKQAGVERADLLFIFVGHGGVDDEGKGYVHLSDGVFRRADLFTEVMAASPADATHVIVDACNAYSLVAGRGSDEHGSAGTPAFEAFLAGNDLEAFPKVGVLVATSDERETHEWSRIRAGVFSHQVRSGLAGAADVNHDGRIEYSEIAAFIEAANAGLNGLGKRITTFAWPPTFNRRADILRITDVDSVRQLVIGERVTGRFYLESAADERWVELHKPVGESVAVALPNDMPFFLRDGEYEAAIRPGKEPLRVDGRPRAQAAVAQRGAVDHAFEAGLFAVPFGMAYYQGYVSARKELVAVPSTNEKPLPDTTARIVVDAPEASDCGSPRQGRDLRAEAGYSLAQALLLSRRRISNGVYLRLSHPLRPRLEVSGQIEGNYARLRPRTGVDLIQLGLLGGVAYRQPVVGSIEAVGGLEIGWSVAVLTTSAGSTDPGVPMARARVGIAGSLWGGWGWSFTGTASGYLLTLDGGEEPLARFGMHVGVTW